MAKSRIAEFRLREISSVDRPCHEKAMMTIMKRAPGVTERISKYWSEDDQTAKTFKEVMVDKERTKRMWEAREKIWPLNDALSSAVSTITSDAKLSAAQRRTKIKQSVEDFMAAVLEVLPEAEEELAEAINKFVEDLDKKAGSSGSQETDEKGEPGMSDDLKKQLEDLQKKFNEAEARSAAIQKQLDVEKSLTDADRLAIAKMSDKEKDDFLALTPAKRKEHLAKRDENDEVLEIDGTSIRKSAVGESQFAMFKAQDKRIRDQAEELRKAREKAETVTLTKRAETEFDKVPGTVEEKVAVFKAVEGLDEKVRKDIYKVFAIAQRASDPLFKALGSSGAEDSDGKTVEEQFEAKVEEIAKRDKIAKSVALAKAAEENPALYDAMEKARKSGGR